MADIAVRVDQLGKRYRINHQIERERYVALRDVLAQATRRMFTGRRGRPRPELSEDFWALRDLSFEIERGDVVGVMGRNGAGKSTLLKVLSRITEPSCGRVTIQGRVASLLEVGTGFHPELTGRENIFLNGAILGMSRSEVRRKFDEIVDFADVERFLDTPVKRYSSGMYMRLAFAVAAFLESDTLVVDEVLAVGDSGFQKKCLGRMGDVSASGRTVLFVSHNIGSMLTICRSGILLDGGRLVATGDIRSVVESYQALGEAQPGGLARVAFVGPLREVLFEAVSVNGRRGSGPLTVMPGEEVRISARGRVESDVPNVRFGIALLRDGVRLFTAHDGPENLPAGAFEVDFAVPAKFLRPGEYMVSLGVRRVDGNEWLWGADLASVTVLEEWSDDYDRDDSGLVSPPARISRATAISSGAQKLRDGLHADRV
jgi:lipopolysaccharide transport system ATP-binding protein